MSEPFGRGHGTGADTRDGVARGRLFVAAPMVCAAFVVLLGVLLMHSVPMVHPPNGHSVASASAVSALHSDGSHDHHADVVDLTAAVAAGSGVVVEMGCSDGCSPHVGMAMCMAVVSVIATLLVARRFLGQQPATDGARGHTGSMGRHSSRAPPWAAPSLEKLSVLRI